MNVYQKLNFLIAYRDIDQAFQILLSVSYFANQGL